MMKGDYPLSDRVADGDVMKFVFLCQPPCEPSSSPDSPKDNFAACRYTIGVHRNPWMMGQSLMKNDACRHIGIKYHWHLKFGAITYKTPGN